MRLICPNCGAQYEVPDDAIPAAGRDVQCSNCGHTWFEWPAGPGEDETEPPDMPPAGEEVPEPEPEPVAASADDTMDEPGDDPDRAVPDPGYETPTPADDPEESYPDPDQPEPETAFVEDVEEEEEDEESGLFDEDDDDDFDDEDPDEPGTEVHPAARRRELDPGIADVLRSERETSEALRKGEPLESQSDMDLDEPARSPRVVPMPTGGGQRPRGESARKELLPDIEEINSTLTSADERRGGGSAHGGPDTPEGRARVRRAGFRIGFGIVLLIGAAAAMVYNLTPEIVARAPQLEGPLTAYADWVDGLRLWLDVRMQALMARLES